MTPQEIYDANAGMPMLERLLLTLYTLATQLAAHYNRVREEEPEKAADERWQDEYINYCNKVLDTLNPPALCLPQDNVNPPERLVYFTRKIHYQQELVEAIRGKRDAARISRHA